jgi:RNA polymerase sigma factor (sigma-70 family)
VAPPAFPDTHWSQILDLGDPAHPRHAEHWEGLVRRYWKPLYHYVRAMRDVPAQDAEDLAQDFFEMMLRRVDFAKLSPDRGSFRAFLKTALRRFVVSADRKKSARPKTLPFAEAEAERAEGLGPDEAFDREWARGVLAEALNRLRAEMPGLRYELFREYLAGNESYEELAKRHGVSLDDVRNGLRAVRQRGREVLKELLRDYLLPGEDVEVELRFILSK